MWVPIGFEKSFRMAYSRTRYGTGYYIYHQFVAGHEAVAADQERGTAKTPPDADVLELIGRAGQRHRADAGERRRHGRSARARPARGDERGDLAQRRRAADDPRARAVRAGSVTRSRSRPRACGSPGTIASSRRSTRRSRCSSAPARSTTATTASTWSRRSRSTSASTATASTCACYFPMPFFRSARRSSWSARTTDVDDVRWTVRHAPLHRPAEPRRLLPRHLPRPPDARAGQGPRPARHARRPKAAATGRAASSARPSSSPTTPSSPRSKATRASSSTTARRRRPTAPAPKSGAAAATTGAAAT